MFSSGKKDNKFPVTERPNISISSLNGKTYVLTCVE